MRIAWFRATAPDPGSVTDETAAVIAGLRDSHHLDIVTEAEAHDFVWRHFREPYDACVYELGSTPAHQFLRAYLPHYPGIIAPYGLGVRSPASQTRPTHAARDSSVLALGLLDVGRTDIAHRAVSRARAAGIPVAQHVALTSDAGVSQRALEDFFGCKVTVGVEVAGVHFTREWLRRPVSSLDEVLRNKLLALCQDEIRADEAPAQTLLQYIEKSGPAIRSSDDMARTLGISRRTLGRMFEREGVSYSTLAREVGLRRARNLLRKGDSVDQVAESLGFSEERSFRRAFKSWTGSTPAEYRARALATASQSGPTERGA